MTLDPRQAGPEVPFPLKIIDDLLCRECPFPAKKSGMSDKWISDFEQWRSGIAADLTAGFIRLHAQRNLSANNQLAEPGVPFPLKVVDDLLCRDCPFPSKEAGLSDEQIVKFENWRKDIAARLKSSTEKLTLGAQFIAAVPNTDKELTDALRGRKLRVAPPDAVLTDDYIEDRITIFVDDNSNINELKSG